MAPESNDEIVRAWAALRAQRAAARDAMRAAAQDGEHPEWSQRASDNVDVDQLRAALTGELDAESREAALDAALRGGAYDDIALLHAATHAAHEASAVTAATSATAAHAPRRARRRIRWVGPTSIVALAAVLVVAIWLPRRIAVQKVPVADVRGGASASVELILPVANAPLRDTLQFSWHAVRGATRYDFELLDASGAVIQQVTTTDTTMLVAMRDAAASPSAWWVRATRSDGTRVQGSLRLLAARAAQP